MNTTKFMKKAWRVAAVAMILCLMPFTGVRTALAATIHWVNDDDPNGGSYAPPGTSCNNPGYPTIQSAVTAAASGDTIRVCPGTYIEQVTIPAGKNNLTLLSTTSLAAIIKAPAVMVDPKAIVRVNGATGVTVRGFTITGPGGGPCDSLRYGVRVDGGGSATIRNNHITEIRDEPFSGCQNGVAILVGRQLEAQVGSATIVENLIDKYQKNGPTVSNVGSSATITGNIIRGIGPTAIIAQNGVQVSGGATATVSLNVVSDHVYTPQTFASTGMLLFLPGVTVISENRVSTSDVGIYLFLTDGANVTGNQVTHSTFDGIAVFGNGNTLRTNRLEFNGGPGVALYDSAANIVRDNVSSDNGEDGILLDNAGNNNLKGNRNEHNGRDGIRANELSMGNTIDANQMQNNIEHDCHDDSVGVGTAGTANTWTNNQGQTENRPGLCQGKDGDGEDEEGDDDEDEERPGAPDDFDES
jgi:parallel beta-helix repeat protein